MKLNRQSLATELLFAIVTVLFLWGSFRIMNIFKEIAAADFNPIPIILAMFIVSVLFGVLTGIPALLERWKSSRRFNWPRLIMQGIPALLLSAPYLLMSKFMNINLYDLFWVQLQVFSHNGFIIYLAGVWFGRVLVDCIKGANEVI